jgi:Glycosyltransferase family 87
VIAGPRFFPMDWLDQELIGTVDQSRSDDVHHLLGPEASRPHRGPTTALSSRMYVLAPGLAVIAASMMGPFYLSSLRPPAGRIVDFFQEWASARNHFQGLPVYANHRVTIPRYLGLEISRPQDLTVEVNGHPPTSVLLALPLAAFPYRDAVLAWNLASLGMLAVSLYLVWRGLRIPFSTRRLFLLIASLLVCSPLILQFFFAQLNLVLLLLLTGTWAADRSGRPLLAGALLGTATAIKIFPGFVFLYFLLRGEWKALIAGALAVTTLTGLTAAVLGVESYRSYIDDVLGRVAGFRGGWPNASLVGFWVKLFDPPLSELQVEPLWRSPAIARIGIVATCAPILVALASMVRRAATGDQRDLAFGSTLTAMLLVSPITWDHYLLLLAVPIAVIGTHLPRSTAARALFAVILVAFWSSPSIIQHLLIPGGKSHGIAHPLQTVTLLSYQCYALIALFGLGVAATFGGHSLGWRIAGSLSSATTVD